MDEIKKDINNINKDNQENCKDTFKDPTKKKNSKISAAVIWVLGNLLGVILVLKMLIESFIASSLFKKILKILNKALDVFLDRKKKHYHLSGITADDYADKLVTYPKFRDLKKVPLSSQEITIVPEESRASSFSKETVVTLLAIISFAIFIFGILWLFVPLYNFLCSSADLYSFTKEMGEVQASHKYVYLNPDGKGYGGGNVVVMPSRHWENGVRTVFIKFLTTVDRELPLHFYSEQSFVKVKPGKSCLVFFYIANFGDEEFRVSTSYEVVPEFDSYFFKKLQCFCFDDQVIKGRSVTEVPVVFYLDPEVLHGSGFSDWNLNIAVEYNLHPRTVGDSKASLHDYPKSTFEERVEVVARTRARKALAWPYNWVDSARNKVNVLVDAWIKWGRRGPHDKK